MPGTSLTRESSKTQAAGVSASAASAVVSAYSNYSSAKHSNSMASMEWEHNKALALESLKVNQYIANKNRIELLTASALERQTIQVEELKAKANAEVTQAAFGIKGGSAQQVLFSISRDAEKAESTRRAGLEQALYENQVQSYAGAATAYSSIGIEPIGEANAYLAIGSAATEFTAKMEDLFREDLTSS